MIKADPETKSVMDWIGYVDTVGYCSYEEFLGLPSKLINQVIVIRTAENLRKHKEELMETKDVEVRKKLNSNIDKLEAFFK